ncbi:Amuc_1098 family type IV pilus outer membrane protein [Prosthecobacter sp.]|uniref:Amuc_1098 family type IV pilus outer membrane protein n=1 Tax=Prosthecobacter sp. TaxID=1965333 RepID=UPI0031BAC7C1
MLLQPIPKHPEAVLPRRLLTRGAVACLIIILGGNAVLPAGAQSVSAMAQAETRRRAIQVNTLNTEIERGYQLIDQEKAAEALTLFEGAYKALPDIPLAQESRMAARNGYVVAGCLIAQELAANGDIAGAGKLLDKLLAPDVAPKDARVLSLKQRLGDPDRFPPALTAKHVDNVGAVQTLLLKASSFLQLGDLDKANTTFQDVLRIDPTNSAARRGMENVEREKQKYYKTAFDQHRAKMLGAVTQSWEDPVPLTDVDRSSLFGASAASLVNQQTGSDRITQKLRTITFPKVEFDGATLAEVVELLRVRSRDLDPEGTGISFVLSVPPEARDKQVSLNLLNVPMEELLRYVSEMCGVAYKVDDHAVIFLSISERNNAIVTRSFRVPPDFIQNSPGADPGAAPPTDPFATQAPAGGGLIIRRLGAKEFLEARGVTFPEGTSASYNASTNALTVRNTIANMETVEMIVDTATKATPKMAVIHVRMLEVNQKNLEELGFDWLMGSAGINSSVFFGGGSAGNGTASSSGNYPFNTPYTIPPVTINGEQAFPALPAAGALAGPVPAGTTAPRNYGGGPVTSGLRSGDFATSANSIDSLLQTGSVTGNKNVAPGVLSIAGVFTNPQFQTVLRALSQKKGVDVNASPSVTTKSGLKAIAEVTQEFIYPTEFDPPRLPQGGGRVTTGAQQQQIATPTTPTAFEMRKTGVLVEVEPIISEDGRTVELTIAPEMTAFEGFVNYGSPIYVPAAVDVLPIQLSTGATGYVPLSSPDQLITQNLILQPVFKVQKVTTAVKVYDGATVVLGGVKIQNRTMVEDKVPILGDLPFVGRFFKSNTKQTDTKNVIIFVTVEVVDPSGRRVNRDTAAVAP